MADVTIPQEVLEAIERNGQDPPERGAPQVEGISEQDLREQGEASSPDELEGLEEALPDEPDPADRELPGADEDPDAVLEEVLVGEGDAATRAPSTYVDESGRLFIGKQFTLPELARWFAVQNLGAAPYNGIGIHHTAIPTGRKFVGTKTVQAIFDFYVNEHGWTRGKGPHFWLYGGDNPGYHPGQILVVVGTHPRHDGIGITGRNHRWVHIEAFGNFDDQRMPDGVVRGYKFLLQMLSKRRNQPVKINHGPSMSGPSAWQGGLFHRDAKTNIKSCPGNTTTHDWFDKAMTG